MVNLAALGRKPGRYGGTLRMLIGSQKDIRLMTIYGYARLVGYDEKLELAAGYPGKLRRRRGPDLHLPAPRGPQMVGRQPVTTEDFRYCWEDVLLNEDLSPGGLPLELLVDGKPPTFEIVDALTVRYSWDEPNPDFLPSSPRRSRS